MAADHSDRVAWTSLAKSKDDDRFTSIGRVAVAVAGEAFTCPAEITSALVWSRSERLPGATCTSAKDTCCEHVTASSVGLSSTAPLSCDDNAALRVFARFALLTRLVRRGFDDDRNSECPPAT